MSDLKKWAREGNSMSDAQVDAHEEMAKKSKPHLEAIHQVLMNIAGTLEHTSAEWQHFIDTLDVQSDGLEEAGAMSQARGYRGKANMLRRTLEDRDSADSKLQKGDMTSARNRFDRQLRKIAMETVR